MDKLRFFPGLLFFALLLLGSCHSDQAVDRLNGRFQAGYRKAFATTAPLLVFSSLPARLDSLGKLRKLVATLDTHYLSREGKDQRMKLQHQLEEEWAQWWPYRHNPALYNLGGLLKKTLLASAGSSPSERLEELRGLLDQAGPYYAAARQNLTVGDITLYRLAAQKQYLGLELLRGELRDTLAAMPLAPAERQAIYQKVRQTELILKDYMGFCESVYLNYQDSTHYAVTDARERKSAPIQ